MTNTTLTRQQLIDALVAALQPLDDVYAFWEGGAAGFDRVDQWSDADLQLIVHDDHVEDAFEVVEATLQALSPVDLQYRLPEPTWHGHSQCFYRLTEAGPFLLVDLAVMKESSEDKFFQFKTHGAPQVLFDKQGLIQEEPLDPQTHLRGIQARLESLKVLFDLFQILTLKELARGNHIEALAFYMGHTLRPLVEVLRIQHCPQRYQYHTRYLHYDLPPDIVQRLTPLFYVQDADQLRERRAQAEAWFWDVLRDIDLAKIEQHLAAL